MRKLTIYIMVSILTFGLVPVSLAQNFAGTGLKPVKQEKPQQVSEELGPPDQAPQPKAESRKSKKGKKAGKESMDDLTDDEVKQILVNEGIPLEYNPSILESTSKYTLGINDIIDVAVTRHPEVSGQYGINNEGKIQYEFVGDVAIAGKTKGEVADLLKEVLSKYIINPEVNVKIAGYNSKVVYVIGEVGAPGKIYMRGDTISVREALVQSGLPQLSAKSGDGRLITPSASGNILQKKVNVYKLLYEGDLRENLVMKPGDTLYLPPTFFAKVLRIIQPVAAPVVATGGGVSSGRGLVP